jgi:hypothetical protein
MRRFIALTTIVATTALGGCDSKASRTATSRLPVDAARADSLTRARQDSTNRTLPGYVIDSIFPPEEELRRFRAALGGGSATTLAGGSPSRDALVRRFVTAVAANDTTDLRAMAVHSREFADLYYPDSPYSRAPYRQSPSLAWRLIQDPSLAGLTKLVHRFGGKPMTYVNHSCDPKVAHDGSTTRFSGCIVTVREASGEIVTRRFFGSIIARGGQYKFLSYTNQF